MMNWDNAAMANAVQGECGGPGTVRFRKPLESVEDSPRGDVLLDIVCGEDGYEDLLTAQVVEPRDGVVLEFDFRHPPVVDEIEQATTEYREGVEVTALCEGTVYDEREFDTPTEAAKWVAREIFGDVIAS